MIKNILDALDIESVQCPVRRLEIKEAVEKTIRASENLSDKQSAAMLLVIMGFTPKEITQKAARISGIKLKKQVAEEKLYCNICSHINNMRHNNKINTLKVYLDEN